MIGVPMPDPREQITDHLNRALEEFFGAGKQVQQIAPGVSGERELTFGTAYGDKLRAKRDKLAPALKKLAENGATLYQAATEVGIDHKRAKLIARENDFTYADS
ncbi:MULTISPECIES: hypothetical protein [Pseudomonas]|uniref:hypothetical protein n=1 Tax=Pseudomonas TaxID=286 RepID=UPI001070DAA8|nr:MULTISPECIES: hypothetical protein [Pseudomonas]QBR32852.1 hypothetical protein E3Z29_21140 [Pseudomonas sp. S150]UZT91034.1 hypothetical protein OPS05_18135 [Pseudomonas koreensis]